MSTLVAKDRIAKRVNWALGVGFAILILMMAGLAAHAIWHIHALEARMAGIVEVQNLKIQLATDLLEAAYNRHSALIYQTLSDDPFERDENFQLYIRWGYHVGKARNDLKALPLDAIEQDNLQRQDHLVLSVVEMQERISDLASRGEIARAQTLIATELRPLNLQFTNAIERLRLYERDRIHEALVSTQTATHQAINVHLGLCGVLLLLAIAIAVTTHHQLARRAVIIDAQVSALEQASDRLEHEATHDPLTGLANRALFNRRLASAIAHAQEEGFEVGVMYLDLDDFKPINDHYGHAAGDILLQTLAARLRELVRVSYTVARLGGDEFAILLVGTGLANMHATTRSAIERELSRPVFLGEVTVTPGCSIGCAAYPQDGSSQDDLIRVADVRMYENKQQHKQSKQELG